MLFTLYSLQNLHTTGRFGPDTILLAGAIAAKIHPLGPVERNHAHFLTVFLPDTLEDKGVYRKVEEFLNRSLSSLLNILMLLIKNVFRNIRYISCVHLKSKL